jgi:hypothetical protein
MYTDFETVLREPDHTFCADLLAPGFEQHYANVGMEESRRNSVWIGGVIVRRILQFSNMPGLFCSSLIFL